MPTRSAIVPRITRKQVEQMKAIAPGVSYLTIPVIANVEQAEKFAREQVKEQLGTYGSMNRKASKIEELPDGWKITFDCSNAYY